MTNNSYNKAIAQKLSNQQLKKEIAYLKSHGASEKDIQELKKDAHKWFCADRCFYEKNNLWTLIAINQLKKAEILFISMRWSI